MIAPAVVSRPALTATSRTKASAWARTAIGRPPLVATPHADPIEATKAPIRPPRPPEPDPITRRGAGSRAIAAMTRSSKPSVGRIASDDASASSSRATTSASASSASDGCASPAAPVVRSSAGSKRRPGPVTRHLPGRPSRAGAGGRAGGGS